MVENNSVMMQLQLIYLGGVWLKPSIYSVWNFPDLVFSELSLWSQFSPQI